MPQACLVCGAFVVYLLGRLLKTHNELLALLTALFFGVALSVLIPLFKLTKQATCRCGATLGPLEPSCALIPVHCW